MFFVNEEGHSIDLKRLNFPSGRDFPTVPVSDKFKDTFSLETLGLKNIDQLAHQPAILSATPLDSGGHALIGKLVYNDSNFSILNIRQAKLLEPQLYHGSSYYPPRLEISVIIPA